MRLPPISSSWLDMDSKLTFHLSLPFTEEMHNLALELQTLVQDKVGVSAFSSVWNSIARTKAMKRQARRNDRIIRVGCLASALPPTDISAD